MSIGQILLTDFLHLLGGVSPLAFHFCSRKTCPGRFTFLLSLLSSDEIHFSYDQVISRMDGGARSSIEFLILASLSYLYLSPLSLPSLSPPLSLPSLFLSLAASCSPCLLLSSLCISTLHRNLSLHLFFCISCSTFLFLLCLSVSLFLFSVSPSLSLCLSLCISLPLSPSLESLHLNFASQSLSASLFLSPV